MKIFLNLALLFLFPFIALSQSLSDAPTFKKVLKLAQEKNKPVLVIMGIKLPASVNIKVAENPALREQDVLKKMKDNFVVFDSDRSDTSTNALIEKYKIRSYPTYLFLHANGDAFHSEFGNMSNKNRYLLMLERGIALSKDKSMTELEADYLRNKSNNELLQKLIALRVKNAITDNAELIEQYANNLRIGDFNNYETVLFVLQAGPYADGNAYKLAYTNRKIIDSIYKKEPIQVRLAINNTIILNTLNQAIKTKNLRQAQTAANLTRGSNSNNYITANRNANNNMLTYYKAVKDTANYLRQAINHYDTYYMNIGADSIKRLEAKQKQIALERSRQTPYSPKTTLSQAKIDSLKADPNTVVRRETVSALTAVNSVSNSYANALNSAAWSFYETGTKNINYLLKAVTWSTRSIELNPNSNYYDTLAHLFYQLGYFEQALKTQQTAINQAKIDGNPYENFQESLRKIKSKTL